MIYSIYITAKNKREAQKISRHLLDRKLIACANIFPIESMFFWKDKFVDEEEYAIIAKTGAKFSRVAGEVKKIHSYETPCICKFNVEANKDFERWVKKVTDKVWDSQSL